MTCPQLIDLAATTRRKFDIAAAGAGSQLVAAIPSQGTSLFGMIYSGPRVGYYAFKKHLIKKELESRGLQLDSRTKRDYVIPTVVGGVTLGFGAGADAIGHLSQGAAEQAAQPALNAVEWTQHAIRSGFDSFGNHIEAFFNPTIAGQLAGEEYVVAYSGDMGEQIQDGIERFDRVVDTVMPGGAPLCSERTAQLVGEGVAATAIGEVAGKAVESCFPDATGSALKRRLH